MSHLARASNLLANGGSIASPDTIRPKVGMKGCGHFQTNGFNTTLARPFVLIITQGLGEVKTIVCTHMGKDINMMCIGTSALG